MNHKPPLLLLSLMVLSTLVCNLMAPPPTPTPTPTPSPIPPTATPQPPPTPSEPCVDPLGCIAFPSGAAIPIGVALDFSGPTASMGKEMRGGIEIAVEDFGLFSGRQVILIFEDSACSTDGGQAAAEHLAAQNGLIGIIGTTCSSAAVTAREVVTNAGLVMISPSNTASVLTLPENYTPGYLRVAPNDLWQGELVAEFAFRALGAHTMATISDGSPYSDTLQQAACKRFGELGGQCVTQQTIAIDGGNASAVLPNIAAYSPEVLFLPLFDDAARAVIRQKASYPTLQKTILLGSDSLAASPTFLSSMGSRVEGMYFTNYTTAANEAFNRRYREKYGSQPTTIFSLLAYDATTLLLNAARQVSIEHEGILYIPRQALRDALLRTNGYPGFSGTLTCSPTGDCGNRGVLFVQRVQNGTLVRVYP